MGNCTQIQQPKQHHKHHKRYNIKQYNVFHEQGLQQFQNQSYQVLLAVYNNQYYKIRRIQYRQNDITFEQWVQSQETIAKSYIFHNNLNAEFFSDQKRIKFYIVNLINDQNVIEFIFKKYSNILKQKQFKQQIYSKRRSYQIKQYKIIGQLKNISNWSKIFYVQTKETHKNFVIKRIMWKEDQHCKKKFAESCLQQVKMMINLQLMNKNKNQSYCIKVYQCFFSKNRKNFNIVMERAQSNLRDKFMTSQFQKFDAKYNLCKQILQAVSYIHQCEITHRDLKPENILILGQKVKICDFGLSIQSLEQLKTKKMCTEQYRAPEVGISFNGYYNSTIDSWSLGLIFIQIWSDQPCIIKKINAHNHQNFLFFIQHPTLKEIIREFLIFNFQKRLKVQNGLKKLLQSQKQNQEIA